MKANKKLILPAVIALGLIFFIRTYLKQENFTYIGTLEAARVSLSSQLPSTLASLEVREGDPVKEGDPLFRLSAEEVQLNYARAEADYRRAKRLLKTGSISQESFDHLRFKYEEAKIKLGWSEVRSPISATVINTYREPGEWLSPGTKVLTLAHLKQIWAIFYVEQPLLAHLSLGQTVSGTLPDSAEQMFSGTIRAIANEAEFTPKNVQTKAEHTRLVFGVKVYFDNLDERLKPGMSIAVQLRGAH